MLATHISALIFRPLSYISSLLPHRCLSDPLSFICHQSSHNLNPIILQCFLHDCTLTSLFSAFSSPLTCFYCAFQRNLLPAPTSPSESKTTWKRWVAYLVLHVMLQRNRGRHSTAADSMGDRFRFSSNPYPATRSSSRTFARGRKGPFHRERFRGNGSSSYRSLGSCKHVWLDDYRAIIRVWRQPNRTCHPPLNGTNASFHSFWGQNIGDILFLLLHGSRLIRPSNENTGTYIPKPDFGLLVNLKCLFRGEEKPHMYSSKDARAALINKLTWRYDPAPYVLG